MRKNTLFILVLVLAVALCSTTVLGKGFKKAKKDGPMAAIMDFDNQAGGWGGWRLGRAASNVLATELVKGTSLRCMERDKLDSIMKEKNLSAAGLTTPDTYVKMGGMLGVQYIVTGAVTSFGEKQIGGRSPLASVKIKTYKAVIDVRIIDAQTGEIVFAESAEGEKASPKIYVLGSGGGEDFNEQAAQKVLRVACKNMAKLIEEALE
jgi:curli biogenesis system outer membrane secretion channel CsgG